ncbi:MAG: leucine-rich repeat domain-containing protein [Bacteroidales bacterium]|nr:leucine-rich repeat domain-containing protein [Bacteroidales bacterium]
MKRLLLLICTLLCANVLLAQTYDGFFSVGNIIYAYNWNWDGHTAVVYGYDYENPPTNAVIDESVFYSGYTYNVVGIADYAFMRAYTENGWETLSCSSLTSVDIPNSVTSIGYSAFYGCSNLTSVDIPNSVTSIGNYAFCNCSSLTSVTIPNSVTSIGTWAFAECSNLNSISIGSGVISIGEEAFYHCTGLDSIELPNNITTIGRNCFDSCINLTTVNIPTSLSVIDTSLFRYCTSLTSITIPENITDIKAWSFWNCHSLTSINIPNSVTSIGEQAFAYCNTLSSVTLGNSVTSIGDYAFYNCSSLSSVTIPNSVTSIGEGTFAGCSSLSSVTCLSETAPILAEEVFLNTPNEKNLIVPCGALDNYINSTWNDYFANIIEEIAFTITANVNNDAFGSVAVESDCSTATLTATANDGYVFLSWNDGNTENPRLVSLSSDTAFTAIFALIDESSLLEAEAESISFFPNPTNSKVTFNQAIERIELIDLAGKTLRTYENESEINIEQLPAGVYYLRLTNNEKQTLRKLIKE